MLHKNPARTKHAPAWALAAFVMATLHTAPMPKDAFGGSLIYNNGEVESTSSLMAPDLGWLRFIDRVTRPDAFGHVGRDVFSPWGFVSIYADHREKYGKANAPWIRVRRG